MKIYTPIVVSAVKKRVRGGFADAGGSFGFT
jgi:hypothetical protein